MINLRQVIDEVVATGNYPDRNYDFIEKVLSTHSAYRKIYKMLKRNKVAIIADPIVEVSQGGIIIPPTAKDTSKIKTGTIKFIGSEVDTVAVGDHVHYESVGGHFLSKEIDGNVQELLIMPVDNVIGIIEKP